MNTLETPSASAAGSSSQGRCAGVDRRAATCHRFQTEGSAFSPLCAIGRPIGVVAFCFVVLAGTAAWAQVEPPFGVTLVGTWDGWSGSEYADVWGDGDYAYVAHFGDEGVHILDISDPTNPTEVAHVRALSPNTSASAQDVKVGDGLLFIALE